LFQIRPGAALRKNSFFSVRVCFAKIIASIEAPAVINEILAHLDEKAATARARIEL